MGSGKSGQVVGYKYFLGVDFKWCHAPVDAFRKLFVDNRKVWEGTRQSGQIQINKPKLFGEYEGGVSGTLDVLDGDPTQLQNAYLVSKLGSGVPAYRGVTSTVLNQMYLGNNPYLKGWTAEISRIHRRLMNGTAIVQWQDNYAAIPAFSDSEEGYSSLINYYGATIEPSQILIQIDLSSHTNGFQNQYFTRTGVGGDIVATKSAVIGFLIYLRDHASWTTGDVDLGIAYFRATNGAANVDNDGSPSKDPNTIVEGEVYEAPKRGVKIKAGLTKADIPELIEYVQGLKVFPDTTDLTSLSLADNAVQFFSGLSSGDKHRSNFAYSSFDFTETVDITTTNVTTLNTQLNGGLSTVTPSKVAFDTSGTYTGIGELGPAYQWYGYTSLSQFAVPTGWTSVADCTGFARSNTWGVFWADSFTETAASIGCLSPAGWSGSPVDPLGTIPPPSANFYLILTYAYTGIYATRWFPYLGWIRSSGSEPFNFVYTKPDGTTGTTPPNYNLIDSNSNENNPNVANLLSNLSFTTGGLGGGLDMNPIHVIRECLTDQEWGLGIPESEIDETSFLAAAITVYNERFGISTVWNRQTEVEDFIKTILNHVNASLYVRRDTGKWFIKLIRKDYDIGTIPSFTDDDVVSWDQITRKTEAELVNSVTVKFNSRALRGPASLTVNNLAQIQQLGSIVPATVNYPCIWQPSLAALLAERDLRALSSATISGSISVTRKGNTLYPGDVFKLTSSRYGLNGEVMRVVEVSIGDGTDNSVYVKFVQDVFAMGSIPITGGAGGEWNDVLNEALPVQDRVIEEENYRNFFRRNGEQLAGELYGFDNNLGFISAFGKAPTPDAINARIYYDAGAGYTNGGVASLVPTAELAAPVQRVATDTTWTLTNVSGLNTVLVNTLAYIDGEFVRVDSINTTTNTITVGRGCLDTIPTAHIAGAKIFFFEEALNVSSQQFVASDSLSIKLLTNSGYGQLDESLAPIDTLTFDSRIHRPYPVGKLQINGFYEDLTYSGTLNVTWAHRDRTLQTGDIPEDHTASNIGPEAGTTYTIKGDQYDPDNTFVSNLFTITGVTGTSQSVDTATYPMTITDGYVRISVTTVRGGVSSRVSPYIDYYPLIDIASARGTAWYDANQLSTIFQNSDRTGAVTTDGQSVGYVDNIAGNVV